MPMTPDIEKMLAAIYRPGIALVTLTTIGGEALLQDATVAHAFLHRVMAVTRRAEGRLVGYVLLVNHAHLIVAPGRVNSPSDNPGAPPRRGGAPADPQIALHFE